MYRIGLLHYTMWIARGVRQISSNEPEELSVRETQIRRLKSIGMLRNRLSMLIFISLLKANRNSPVRL